MAAALSGRRALVTGGGSGIGLACARALDLSVARASGRKLFGTAPFDQQMTQSALAETATDADAAALPAYRAADRCVQPHGGLGGVVGSAPEILWREVRTLRVCEGASETRKRMTARAEKERAA